MTPESKATQPENQEQDTTMGWERKYKAQNYCQTGYVFEDRLRKYRQKTFFLAWSYYDYPFNLMLKMLSAS